MLQKTFYFALIVCAAIVFSVLLSLPTPSVNEAGSAQEPLTTNVELTLIKNASVFDGKTLIGLRDIELRDGLISNIDQSIEADNHYVIDAKNRVLIPGLIDAHTHSFGDALWLSLNFGVTSNIDMFSPNELISNMHEQRASVEYADQADLFSAGMLATVDGGHGTQFGVSVETISSPDQAEQWVSKRLDEGSDFIKLVYMPYSGFFKSLDRATAAAIIKHAHNRNQKVLAHVSSFAAAQELLDDGIDGFVHIFADEIASTEFIEQAKRRNIFVIPTLSVISSAAHHDHGQVLSEDSAIKPYLQAGQAQQLASKIGSHKLPGFDLETALENIKLLAQAGVPILAGSDAPNPGTSYGASLHQEIELLIDAGLNAEQALSAASGGVAQHFDLEGRGIIEVGARADLVMLDDTEISKRSSRNIAAIFKNGKQITRKRAPKATPDNASGLASGELSDFENGLTSNSGKFRWSKTDDSMVDGLSIAAVEHQQSLLAVHAQVKSGFMFPWAGANVFSETAWDISRFSDLEFRFKGEAGSYRVMLFSSSLAGPPPSQNFVIEDSNDWTSIKLAINDFNGFNSSDFIGLAIVAGPALGEFKYQLDGVKLTK